MCNPSESENGENLAFDLEQAIMSCWAVTEDINLLTERLVEVNDLDDELANALIGIGVLHSLRCEKLLSLFTKFLKQKSERAVEPLDWDGEQSL